MHTSTVVGRGGGWVLVLVPDADHNTYCNLIYLPEHLRPGVSFGVWVDPFKCLRITVVNPVCIHEHNHMHTDCVISRHMKVHKGRSGLFK